MFQVWRKGAQVQRVSLIGEEGEAGMCGKATKGATRGETSAP